MSAIPKRTYTSWHVAVQTRCSDAQFDPTDQDSHAWGRGEAVPCWFSLRPSSQLLHSCPRERQLEPCAHDRNPLSLSEHTQVAHRFIKNPFSGLLWCASLLRDFWESRTLSAPLNMGLKVTFTLLKRERGVWLWKVFKTFGIIDDSKMLLTGT